MNIDRHIAIDTPEGRIFGTLHLPEHPRSLIIMPRCGEAHAVQATVLAALLPGFHGVLDIEMLTHDERPADDNSLNIHLCEGRLLHVLDFLREDGDSAGLPLGIFSIGNIASAAIRAAARRDAQVQALVVYQGLIDNAGTQYLEALAAPLRVLLDPAGESLNPLQTATLRAFAHLATPHEMELAAPDEVPTASLQWFSRWLPPAASASP